MTKMAGVVAMLVVMGMAAVGVGQVRVRVEAEEDVYRLDEANNGAGAFWCFGSTCIGRVGDEVWASGLELIPGAKPLNNVTWVLWRRTSKGWEMVMRDQKERTREPSPMGVFGDGSVLLSVNPTLTKMDEYAGPARPEILRFKGNEHATILPVWEGKPKFTEHSYRSFVVDAERAEMILFQNIGYTHAEWAFCDGQGRWTKAGKLLWPWGAEYARPEPIRVCYPTVQLKGRSVYWCGVSDIVEPNPEWREFKKKLTGRQWDYDFRRLFYTWCEDVTKGKFEPWVEIASREKTCGWVSPCDLLAEENGRVNVLWTERALDVRLREKFFPNETQSEALNWAVVQRGKVVMRRTILEQKQGQAGETPGRGQFKRTADGRLFVFFYVSGKNGGENRVVELKRDGTVGEAVRVPLKKAMGTFFTANERGGTKVSDVIDVLGDGGRVVRYAKVRILDF